MGSLLTPVTRFVDTNGNEVNNGSLTDLDSSFVVAHVTQIDRTKQSMELRQHNSKPRVVLTGPRDGDTGSSSRCIKKNNIEVRVRTRPLGSRTYKRHEISRIG